MIDKRDVQAFFDRLAPDWDADMVRNEAVIARILDNAGVCDGCTVLDVACGTGVLFGDYVKRGAARVTAVDLSPEMAARAAEKLAEISGGAGSIIAAIGPCARPCCYEVSDELYGIFTAADPENAAAFVPCRRGHYMLDMAKIIKRDLNRAGVPDERISDSGICTICGGDDFFSHRVSGENRGTMAAFIQKSEKGS